MDSNSSQPSNPTPFSLLKDISNFKTPKRTPHPKPSPSSKPLRRGSVSNKKAATARRLKLYEIEQCKSLRNAQLKKERSLKSLSKALSTWLNFLLRNPSLCGCGSVLEERKGFEGLRKRGSDYLWRLPKRLKGEVTERIASARSYGVLRSSLKDVCSFDDLKERLRVYLSLSGCQEVFDVMSNVVKVIDDGRLKMKSHCPVVTDVGMKEKAVRILMCYNSFWLRIGLHIVFGGDSLLIDENVTSEQEMLFLKMVIEKQFFSHTGLAKDYAYNKNVEGLYKPGYFEALGNVILKRLFLLVLVLDRAKSQSTLPIKYGIDGIDGGSPPLFVAQSSIKSSRDVINDFLPSEVMHGQGNLLAHLVIIGYKVLYQQCPLVDYDFKVKDLFVDLQDGVRLCRAIQLLKNDASILSKLVVPSNTHKKNLANCGLALQYLRRAGVSLNDEDGMEIMEDDIANGEKELTLSLLWNIFLQLQLPLLIDNRILRNEIEKISGANEDFSRRLNLDSSPLELLRTWIQAVCKKYDQEVNNFSSLVDGKAVWCILDYYFRKELSCSHSLKDASEGNCEESIMSSIDHSNAVHNFILSQKLTTLLGDFPEVLETSDILEHGGATSEQSVVVLLVFLSSQLIAKKTMDQLNFHKLLECGCQSSEKRRSGGCSESLRTRQDKEEVAEHNNEDAARKFKAIKAWWQDMVERNNIFPTKPVSSTLQRNSTSDSDISIEKVNAATIIQSYFRQSTERKKFLKLKNAVSFLQIVFRAWLIVQKKQMNHNLSAVIVQELINENQSVSEKVRIYVRFVYDRHSFLKLQKSVLLIQRATRIWNAKRKLVKGVTNHVVPLLDPVSAAVVIQKQARGWIARSRYKVIQKEVSYKREVNRLKILEVEAATKIQLTWKKIVARRCLRNQHRAATKIQSNLRGWLLRRKFLIQKQAVTTIQSNFRGWMLRRKFLVQHHAATKIQSNVRGWLLRRKFLIQKQAATSIQSNCRGWLLRRKFQIQKHSVITIQSNFRGQLVRRKFLIQKHAATTIQRNFRGWLLRRKFLNQKHAVTTIQNSFRGWLLRRKYLIQKHAVTTIQSNFRGWLWRRKFLIQKHAVTTIQSNFRRLRCLKALQQLKVARRLRSVIVIQSHVRGWIEQRRAGRRKYLVCVIQRCIRGWLIRRNFLLQKEAVTTIQSVIRGFNCRKWLESRKQAVVGIQRFVRGQITRNKLLGASHCQVPNNMTISSCFSQNLEMKIMLSSIIKLQRWWRHSVHKRRTQSSITIQSHVRGWLVRDKASRDRQRITVIQSYWKGYLARKQSGSQLTDLCSRVQKSARNVDDSMRIINRLKLALSELPKMKSVTEILRTCATLDMATENSQRCCEELVAAGAIDNLLKQIHSLTQSIPDQEILKHALSTLRNLARYQHLIEVLVNSNRSVETIFWVMLRNKEEGYFVASDVLKKICTNQKGLQAMQKLPAYFKRLHMLVEELTKKATNEKKNPRGVAVNTERRLREAIVLLKMMMNA